MKSANVKQNLQKLYTKTKVGLATAFATISLLGSGCSETTNHIVNTGGNKSDTTRIDSKSRAVLRFTNDNYTNTVFGKILGANKQVVIDADSTRFMITKFNDDKSIDVRITMPNGDVFTDNITYEGSLQIGSTTFNYNAYDDSYAGKIIQLLIENTANGKNYGKYYIRASENGVYNNNLEINWNGFASNSTIIVDAAANDDTQKSANAQTGKYLKLSSKSDYYTYGDKIILNDGFVATITNVNRADYEQQIIVRNPIDSTTKSAVFSIDDSKTIDSVAIRVFPVASGDSLAYAKVSIKDVIVTDSEVSFRVSIDCSAGNGIDVVDKPVVLRTINGHQTTSGFDLGNGKRILFEIGELTYKNK